MRAPIRPLILIAVSGLLFGACTAEAAPAWSFPPPVVPAAPAQAGLPSQSPPAAQPASSTSLGTLEVHAVDLGFTPATLTVSQPGTYTITLVNDGAMTHNITFADGTTITADSKATAEGTVAIPAGGTTFLCSIPGHADAGMKGTVAVGANAASSGGMPGMSTSGMSQAPAGTPPGTAETEQADPNAPPYVERDPVAPAAMTGSVHDVDFPIVEKDITVAKGFVVHAWTFGGTVPGPTIRVRLGDTVRVHLTNQGQMSHSIDFHASQTAMDHQMVEIKPGATWTYTFKADYAGVWMYHCGTAPALDHIANGMYGMVIVEPKGGLDRVDTELAFVQSEWYLGGQGQPASYAKANAAAPGPDFVVFNGVANQYKDNPIPVKAGSRVRIFVLDAGPNIDSSFHVVGTVFDTVIKEGVALLRGNSGGWGAQAADLSPAQGAIIELTVPEKGMFTFVTHAFNFVGRGAVGVLKAT